MSGRISSPILVGRAAELATLSSAVDSTLAGRATPLVIAGEAGVGKTRLVEELVRLGRGRGMHVLRGGCSNVGDGGLPYDPIVDALRGLPQDLDPKTLLAVIGSHGADLGRLVPALGPGATALDTTQRDWLQARLFDALLGLFQRLAARAATLLVLEDLHWSDPATREAVTFLVRSLHREPLLLALTFRSDELHRRHPLLPWLAELDRTGRFERLELRRLGQEDTRTLVTAILGEDPGPAAIARIHRRSDGNPFFIEELLLSTSDAGGTERLPTSLREILLARIAAVPESARAVLGAAAVAGGRVDHELLAAVAGQPEPELFDALRSCVTGQLLVVEASDGQREGYAFRHALLQEAAYHDLLPGERRRLHRLWAEAIEARPPESGTSAAAHWAALAHHWSAAGDDPRALGASVRAGEAAAEAFAFGAALRDYERALELWAGVVDAQAIAGQDRTSLLDRAARAAHLSGDSRREVALRREALASLGSTLDRVRLAVTYEQLGRALWNFGDTAGALAACESAVEIMPIEPPTAERARVLAGFGQMLMLLDRWVESHRLLDEAIAIARLVGAREAEGHALNTLGLDLAAEGHCDEADASLRAALAIALETRNADDIGRAYVNLADALFFCGDAAAAAVVVDEGIVAAEAFGITGSFGAIIRQTGMFANFDLGRWDVTGRLAAESFATGQTAAELDRYGLARWVALLVATGAEEAAERLEQLRELIATGPTESQFSGPYYGALAELALWQDRPDEAIDTVERGLAAMAAKETWYWYTIRLLRVGAWAAADLADVGRARRDPAIEARARERGAAFAIERVRVVAASLAEQRGAAAAETEAEAATAEADDRRARGEQDPRVWRDALRRWRARGRSYLVAYVRWREAEACLAQGDRKGAADALAEAAVVARKLGARPLLDRVESLASRARLRLASASPEPAAAPVARAVDPFALTSREREVLGLVALGMTNRQIADRLYISANTAGVHVSHILGKLGAGGRAEAAAIAVRLGLAGDP